MALESAGGSIIAMLAELMVEPVGRLSRYMFCFNNFVEEFEERKENLTLGLHAWHEVYMEGSRAKQIDCFGGVWV